MIAVVMVMVASTIVVAAMVVVGLLVDWCLTALSAQTGYIVA